MDVRAAPIRHNFRTKANGIFETPGGSIDAGQASPSTQPASASRVSPDDSNGKTVDLESRGMKEAAEKEEDRKKNKRKMCITFLTSMFITVLMALFVAAAVVSMGEDGDDQSSLQAIINGHTTTISRPRMSTSPSAMLRSGISSSSGSAGAVGNRTASMPTDTVPVHQPSIASTLTTAASTGAH